MTLNNVVNRIRMVFTWGYENGQFMQPVRYGTTFVKAKPGEIEKVRRRCGLDEDRSFSANEMRRILAAIDDKPAVKAQIMLALNAEYGAADLARLRLKDIDLKAGWARSRRPKTGVRRVARLWDETVLALQEYLTMRRRPADPADHDLLFVTPRGVRFLREADGVQETGDVDPKRWGFLRCS